MKPITIRNYYPREVSLPDSDDRLPIRVRRFTQAQLTEFRIGWARCARFPSERHIYRLPDGDEQERIPDEKQPDERQWDFRIPDSEIRRRRLEEMTDEQRKAFDLEEDADLRFANEFCEKTIRQHIWVDPSANVLWDDGSGPRPMLTGDDLADAFGGQQVMLLRLAGAVWQENTLSPEEKKTLRRLFDLASSLETSGSEIQTAAGPSPAPTAVPAAPTATARNGRASARRRQSRSTLTASTVQ